MSALYYESDFEYVEHGMKEEREYYTKKMKYLQFRAKQEMGEVMDEAYIAEMQEVNKETTEYERLYEDSIDGDEEHVADAFDYEMRAHQEMYDASVAEDARIALVVKDARDAEIRNFAVHQKNVNALAKYYDAVAIDSQSEDAEYEFWLVFEIREYEAGTSTCVADVEHAQYGTMDEGTMDEGTTTMDEERDDGIDRTNWSYQDYDDEQEKKDYDDEQDRMEQYIEGKRADALDDDE